MYAHRLETVIAPQGQLRLAHLPFQPGDQVEVIILRREPVVVIPENPLPYQIEAVHLGAKRKNLDNIAEILDELDREAEQ